MNVATTEEHLLQILAAAIRSGASDVILKTDMPPTMKVHGRWVPIPETEPLVYNRLDEIIRDEILAQRAGLSERYGERRGTIDLAIDYPRDVLERKLDALGSTEREQLSDVFDKIPGYRFRINVFFAKTVPEVVIRLLDNKIRSFPEIGLPDHYYRYLDRKRGLILVTGPTGSGKSTTLAAMIEHINTTASKHIVTIEDPIEYVFEEKRSIISQVEVGTDTPSFAEALRAAMRQAPDVIMVGELRDYDSVSAALSAAETGHLVMGTLHTNSGPDTVSRIIDFFPANHHDQAASQLAATLLMIISQDLIPTKSGA
ncbi:ATPase, T2SS/T4P/T4SS family, partial [Oceanithermus sp.]|uniref:type IV pilus twitching motility protein PilT n=1 Tax=Oceanithermus sp. TaxID=2268145 RepID=UPI00257D2D5A